jgi:hypothetical protein
MTAISFATADELIDYVNTEPVLQANIATITNVDGRWYLFHF